MSEKKGQLFGVSLFMLSIGFIITYGYLLFFTSYWVLVSKITLFLLVTLAFGILAWVGLSMVEASNKVPLEQVKSEIEKEIFGGEDE
ncbi:transcriptional regulator [Thermococcus gorgonarius]|uniref:Transcriptional regulator n=1 Tax=Thermococcus gorgonarius TaxID=71997 RepID=A0A2Z2M9Z5_THEGO|nr:transcriptional regulator [Thermococcus gorgonarius]ASJ01315.1 hypothetical protein A3K92_07385 [Thermococcus gorgonarius]